MKAGTSQMSPEAVQAACERIKRTARQQLIDLRNVVALNQVLQEDLMGLSRLPDAALEGHCVAEAIAVMVQCGAEVHQLLAEGIMTMLAAPGEEIAGVAPTAAAMSLLAKEDGLSALARDVEREPSDLVPLSTEEAAALLGDGTEEEVLARAVQDLEAATATHKEGCVCPKCYRLRCRQVQLERRSGKARPVPHTKEIRVTALGPDCVPWDQGPIGGDSPANALRDLPGPIGGLGPLAPEEFDAHMDAQYPVGLGRPRLLVE